MVFFVFVFAQTAFAQSGDVFGTQDLTANVNLGHKTLAQTVVGIINIFLGLLGIIALCITLYGGFVYMTSGGNEDKISDAKKILVNGTIGLAIILSSWAITKFILAKLGEATGVGGGFGSLLRGGANEDFNNFAGTGAGGRIIKYHFPARDQKDVPRNVRIAITFAAPMDPGSIIENSNHTCWGADGKPTKNCEPLGDDVKNPYYGDCFTEPGHDFNWENDCDKLKTASIGIFASTTSGVFNLKTMNKVALAPQPLPAYALTSYQDGADKNAYTFVFKPVQLLGDDTVKRDYTVGVIADQVKSKDNQRVLNKTYAWTFQTDLKADYSPPTIVTRTPHPGEVVPRNQIVQVVFSKPMDPTTLNGQVGAGQPATNLLFGNPAIEGEWRANDRTAEFVPNIPCGQNSCGEQMYCLPVACAGGENDTACTNDSDILVRTAKTLDNINFAAIPMTGVTDIYGNALDGNADGHVDGKPQLPGDPKIIGTAPNSVDERVPDNSYWAFVISNKIDRIAPLIESVSPHLDEEGVAANAELRINFSKPMWHEKLRDIGLDEHPRDDRMDEIWYFVHGERTSPESEKDSAVLTHRDFGPNGLDFFYFTNVSSTVRDLRQNCLYPGRGPNTQVKGQNVTCSLNEAGVPQNCTPVDFNADSDTGCAQTTNPGFITQPNVKACLDKMRQISNGGGLPPPADNGAPAPAPEVAPPAGG